MSDMSTGPPGTATTASTESDGEVPPAAVATTTACPRAMPLTVPVAEIEATNAFRLAYVIVAFDITLPLASLTITVVPAEEPASRTRGFGVSVSEAGPAGGVGPLPHATRASPQAKAHPWRGVTSTDPRWRRVSLSP